MENYKLGDRVWHSGLGKGTIVRLFVNDSDYIGYMYNDQSGCVDKISAEYLTPLAEWEKQQKFVLLKEALEGVLTVAYGTSKLDVCPNNQKCDTCPANISASRLCVYTSIRHMIQNIEAME